MARIGEVLARLEAIDLDTAIPAIIKQTSYEISLLNQLQLQQGIDGEGNKILPKYKSNRYAKFKAGLNSSPGFGTADLKVTGALYQGIGVTIIDKDKFGISTSVEYGKKLEDYYKANGSTVFKLTTQSKKEYSQNSFYDGLKRYISNVTHLY